MNWSIAFEPLLSWPLLAAILVPIALMALVGLFFRQRGAIFRLAALVALAAALINPVLLDEEREPLKSVVALIVDRYLTGSAKTLWLTRTNDAYIFEAVQGSGFRVQGSRFKVQG